MSDLKNLLMSDNAVSDLRTLVAKNTLRDLEPSLANLKMDIPAGYHHKDNLEHSIRVLDHAIEREGDHPDLILRTAALFHDIGKHATRKFGIRKAVTFDGHEHAGAKMVNRILPRHGYDKDQTKAVAHLVRLHMRSHGFGSSDWTDSAVRRLITDAGDDVTLDRLIHLFHSDSTTKHAHKRARHHAGLEVLRAEVERVKAHDARAALRPAINGHELMSITGLSQGRELGAIMKYLNSDEGITLSYDEAVEYALRAVNA